MKSPLLISFLFLTVAFSSCNKNSGDSNHGAGLDKNTWTFTEGSHVYKGVTVFETGASLSTTLAPSTNSYQFGVLGAETSSGYMMEINIALLDLNFTTKTYKSGVDGTDYLNAFYYAASPVSDDTYKSSNIDPGQEMTYTVTKYDAANDVVTIAFSGKAKDINGNEVNITNGMITCAIDRY